LLTAARRYDFYLRVVKTIFYEQAQRVSETLFLTREDKVISSSHRVMFCLLYSPKQKIVKLEKLKSKLEKVTWSISSLVNIWKISHCVFFSTGCQKNPKIEIMYELTYCYRALTWTQRCVKYWQGAYIKYWFVT
jgi:hypothetical protein